MTQRHRALVIAHGHPDFTFGGGELAAYNLYQALREHPDVEAAWFLARIEGPSNGFIRPRRPGEYLWQQSMENGFLFQAALPLVSLDYFRRLLEELRPSVVFVHHFVHLGIEVLRIVRQCRWPVCIVLTLHEMLAICHHNGQMVKTGSLGLCREATADDCHACFPERTREDFWLRRRFLQKHFELVDHFVTPSKFLKARYASWGLPAERISVIENGQPPRSRLPPRELAENEMRGRFGFFGQVNPYKGIDVLMEGVALLPKEMKGKVLLEIHGANLDCQTAEFRDRLKEQVARLEGRRMLRWAGPYDRDQLPARMAGVDWVVVPSIWWENSPLVIQEAFSFGRPVICSGIGGMAEKVRDGVDGLHVEAGNAAAWASALRKAAQTPGLWDSLASNVPGPPSAQQAAGRYIALAAPLSSSHPPRSPRPLVDRPMLRGPAANVAARGRSTSPTGA